MVFSFVLDLRLTTKAHNTVRLNYHSPFLLVAPSAQQPTRGKTDQSTQCRCQGCLQHIPQGNAGPDGTEGTAYGRDTDIIHFHHPRSFQP